MYVANYLPILKQPVLGKAAWIKNPVISFFLHYIVWEFLYMLMGVPGLLTIQDPNWNFFLFNYIGLGTVNFILFYTCAFFIIPTFFIRRRRLLELALICIAIAVLFTFLKYKIENWYYKDLLERAKSLASVTNTGRRVQALPLLPFASGPYFRTYIWFNFLVIIIAFAYRLLLVWYRHEKITRELENQKLQAELSFLKMQINPHFLFNALNNIYSMAVLEKSRRTGDGIVKLSSLIRYMLYEKEDEQFKVSLDKEISHINNFIDLEKLRHDGDINILFSIDTIDKSVPPLLLFPLIENASKHGVLQDLKRPVNIQLAIRGRQLDYTIHNFKNDFLKDQSGGIGLTNVRKRLDLLYAGRHELIIRETDNDFFVQLQLPL